MTNDDVIRAWSDAARPEEWGDEGDFARRHLLTPAILGLLGEVRGRRILDAGCGQGYLCRMLTRMGAHVTGVEPADGWVAYAEERERAEPLGIRYLRRDLSTLVGFDGEFDAVMANMVLQDIPEYEAAVRTCVRALRPGGHLVAALTHPCFEESAEAWPGKGYVEVREYVAEHVRPQRGSGPPLFHRPLSVYLNLLIAEGCVLRRLVEPRLPAELATPGTPHERNAHVPNFLVLHAAKG